MKPFFLQGQAGSLFAVYYPPVAASLSQAIIHVPAFAEEMNRCRRMVAIQAEAFAKQGIACLVLDLFGTGDSEGDFSDARWSLWQQDIEVARDWLIQTGAKGISLWGIRLGALLALDHAAHSDWRYKTLILCQLQAQGRLALKQFLRLRSSANLLQGSSRQETTQALRERLLAGHSVEVAGYTLSSDLACALSKIDASQMHLPTGVSVLLAEIVAEAGQLLSPQKQKLIADWQADDLIIQTLSCVGASFWTTPEVCLLPELIDHTTRKVVTLLNTTSQEFNAA